MLFLIPVIIVLVLVILAAFLFEYGPGKIGGGPDLPTELPPPIITYDDISGSTPYVAPDVKERLNQHIGQRKLFVSEIQFITKYVGLTEPSLVVYAGGAPSNKAALLAELCPNVLFLLVDPNPFDVHPPTKWNRDSPYGVNNTLPRMLIPGADPEGLSRSRITQGLETVREKYDILKDKYSKGTLYDPEDPRERILLFNTYYVPEHSAALRSVFPTEKIYFLSDIRTIINDDPFPVDVDISWNIAQQYIWSRLLGAEATMVKWRWPWFNPEDKSMISPSSIARNDFDISALGEYKDELGVVHSFPPIDFIADYAAKSIRYPSGVIYLQAWNRTTSGETRLVFMRDAPVIDQSTIGVYEDKLFWYNSVARQGPVNNVAIPRKPTEYQKRKIRELRIDNCNDCAIEATVWQEYILAQPPGMNARLDVYHYMAMLTHATHGRKLHPPQEILRRNIIAKYNRVFDNFNKKKAQQADV